MAIRMWPQAGEEQTELQWSQMARLWQVDGVDGSPATDELRVSKTTGLGIAVAPGGAWVHGFYVSVDATETKTHTANGSAQPRLDRVVLRADITAGTPTVEILEGTPSATPTAPAVTVDDNTGIYELSLGIVRITGSTIPALSDARWFVGRPVVYCASNNRPLPDGRPLVAYETDTKRIVSNNGSGSWTVGLGDDTYRPVTVYSVDDGTTSATSYTSTLSGSTSPTITQAFTAPPSGNVLLRIGANLQTSTSNAYVAMTVRVATSPGGTVVVADDALRVKFNSNTGSGQSGASVSGGRVFNLDPDASYTATLRYLSSSGAATIDDRQLEIHPLP